MSIVLIVYNDAGRLPRAARSALRQTLPDIEVLIVDDGSTDDTAAVAARIAAEDARVRVIALGTNSGGCGVPRNRGVEEARGEWVMFLDSDDELARGACRRLVTRGSAAGADIAAGLAVRVDRATARTTAWYGQLYEREQVLAGAEELPELIWDTIVVNKAYRRDFLQRLGLRFPEGVLYEDLLFTATAYRGAGRIAIGPGLVYRWLVDERHTQRSITNRRHELQNLTSRLEVNRRIDQLLSDGAHPRLAEEKAWKSLKHDVRLHLNDLALLPADARAAVVALLGDYVAGLPAAARERGSAAEQLTWQRLVDHDEAGVLDALAVLRFRRLPASLAARPVAELEGLGVAARELAGARLWAEATVEIRGGVGLLTGRVAAPPSTAGAHLRLELRPVGWQGRRITVPVTEASDRGHGLDWSAELRADELFTSASSRGAEWQVWLVLQRGDERCDVPVAPAAGPLPDAAIGPDGTDGTDGALAPVRSRAGYLELHPAVLRISGAGLYLRSRRAAGRLRRQAAGVRLTHLRDVELALRRRLRGARRLG